MVSTSWAYRGVGLPARMPSTVSYLGNLLRPPSSSLPYLVRMKGLPTLLNLWPLRCLILDLMIVVRIKVCPSFVSGSFLAVGLQSMYVFCRPPQFLGCVLTGIQAACGRLSFGAYWSVLLWWLSPPFGVSIYENTI